MMTPIEIETILHVYSRPTPLHETPAITKALLKFKDGGLIMSDDGSGSGWSLSQGGEKLIGMLLRTPAPVRIWVDPREGVDGELKRD